MDERARLDALGQHEYVIRERTRQQVVRSLVQPAVRGFATPIPCRYVAAAFVDHMVPPGLRDDTGFSDGVC